MLKFLKLSLLFLSLTFVQSQKKPIGSEHADVKDLFKKLYLKNYLEYENILGSSAKQGDRETMGHQFPLLYKIKNLMSRYDYDFANSIQSQDNSETQENLEREFIDELFKNKIFKKALKFLGKRSYLAKNLDDQKEEIQKLWFTIAETTNKNAFQTVILQESKFYINKFFKEPDYLVYDEKKIEEVAIGKTVDFVAKGVGVVTFPQKNRKILIGLSPELEMAIYTVCAFLHPKTNCQIALQEKKFSVFVQLIDYPVLTGTLYIVDAYPSVERKLNYELN